ncbi:MAG: S24 family peptidase [Janthinobacterium lividum]
MLKIEEKGTIAQRLIEMINFFSDGNKSAFGRITDLQSGVIAGFVGGRLNKPGFEVLQKLVTAYPQINERWLLLGEGEMLKGDIPPKNNSVSSGPVTVDLYIEHPDTSGNRLVPLINYKAAANYLTGYQSQELYEELEKLSLPRELLPGKQRYIIFPVTGDSMEPTLWAEDLILCQQVRPERWLELRSENLMVVLSRSHGIQVKRVRVSKALRVLHCRSDNPRSIPFTLSLDDEGDKQADVLELWMVEWFFSKRTEAPERQSAERLEYMETRVDDLHYLLETLLDEKERNRRLRDRDRQKDEQEEEKGPEE